jgi:hypothetical protein
VLVHLVFDRGRRAIGICTGDLFLWLSIMLYSCIREWEDIQDWLVRLVR